MAMVMAYFIPMLLGRTFNASTDQAGIDIFPKKFNPQVIQHYKTQAEYRMIETARQARDFLSVSGEVSLKIKAGILDIKGSGEYLRDKTTSTKQMEVLTKVTFETVTKHIPSTLKPYPAWQLNGKRVLGTHYVRSITYGGELIASLKFKADTESTLEKIKVALKVGFKVYGPLGLDIEGEFQRIQQQYKEKATLEIDYYATVPMSGDFPRNINGLSRLVARFPDMVKAVNKGVGVPIRVELVPLHHLSPTYVDYLRNGALESELEEFESKFDDLRAAQEDMRDWLSKTNILTPSQETTVGRFYSKLHGVMSEFYDVISKLDLSQLGRSQQFTPAYNAYTRNGFNIPGKFMREWLRIKQTFGG